MEPSGDGQAPRTSQAVTARSCQLDPPALRTIVRTVDQPRLVWNQTDGSTVAGGAVVRITADGTDRFERVRREATELFSDLAAGGCPAPARPRLYGGFAFTDTHSDPGPGATWDGYPGAMFVLPAVQIATTSDGSWLTTTATGPHADQHAAERLAAWRKKIEGATPTAQTPPPTVLDRSYAVPLREWQREIEQATGRIRQGELRKVVLAQALTAALSDSLDVGSILERLGDSYPRCFRFAFEPTTGGTFFGATPERLVSVDGTDLETEALAGSIGRGETTAEDEWLAAQLRNSEKNNHEHDIVVETIREQLRGYTDEITTGSRMIRKLETVQHLQTPLRATLSEDTHVLDLVEALHPTPAVGGLPPRKALETIRETEVFNRGWYAAPVGWFDADGDGTFAVAIRSALARERSATLFAGAGIVADSDPDEEWDELQLKYRPILDELA